MSEAHRMSQDGALEAEINYAAMRLQTATTPRERRAWWNTLCQLHEEQSDQHAGERTARG